MKVKYPKVKVRLTGQDGNAFFILGRVQSAMKKANISKEEIDKFIQEAESGDYDNLLQMGERVLTRSAANDPQ